MEHGNLMLDARYWARGLGLANPTSKVDAHRAGRFEKYKIAALVPCCGEEVAIAKVVRDFRAALPTATIFVFDNNSTDNTAAALRSAILVLDTVMRGRREMKLLAYLAHRALGEKRRRG
jgi:hypothetical protein